MYKSAVSPRTLLNIYYYKYYEMIYGKNCDYSGSTTGSQPQEAKNVKMNLSI